MSRSDQFIGLHQLARNFLTENAVKEKSQQICPHCNKVIRESEVVKTFPGKYHWAGFDSPACSTAFLEEDGSKKYNPSDCRECPENKECYHVLPGYQLKNGKMVYECVQEEPWSSGPMFFIHLVDDEGNPIEGCSWPQEDIQSYI